MLDALAALVWQAILDDGRDSVPSSTLSALIESGDVELALDSLAEAGLVATWSFEEETHVTLTPFAAERLGLRISRGRWVPANAPERRTRVSKAGIECADPDRIADRRIGEPIDTLIAVEDAEAGLADEARRQAAAEASGRRHRRTDADLSESRLTPPSLVLSGCQPWPPAAQWGRRCPVCRDLALPYFASCLWCDRWGLDSLLARIHRREAEQARKASARRREVKTRHVEA